MTESRNPRITCIGEALVDFVASESGTLDIVTGFEKKLGGEGANVAVGIARLGGRAAFAGVVGDDPFGAFVMEGLRREGVDVAGVKAMKRFKTRLAFVSLTLGGDRDFAFWESAPAGAQLRSRDIPFSSLSKSAIVNIAPLLLINEPSRRTALAIARRLSAAGRVVAFDPNLRPALWKSSAEMKRVTRTMISHTAILRLNEDEAAALTGSRSLPNAARKLLDSGPSLVVVTRGEDGCYFQSNSGEGYVPGFEISPVDTTGCGDAFFATLLHDIAQSGVSIGELSPEQLTSMCVHANAVGALTAEERGGAEAMPYPQEVLAFMKERGWPEQ